MIEQFWTATGVIVVIGMALIGAFWKLGRHADECQKKYSVDISAMEAKIRSSSMLPEIMKLVTQIDEDKSANPGSTLDKILGDEKYLPLIRDITRFENEITGIKNSYIYLRKAISGLSRDMLIMAFAISTIVPVCYLFGTPYVSTEQLNMICLVQAFAVLYFAIFSIAPKVSRYNHMSKDLSSRYDKVIVGIPSNNSD